MATGKPSVFITGASGFVGFAVAKKFAEEGHCVKALVRGSTCADKLERERIEVVRGDIVNPGKAVESAMRGCGLVVHTAALHDMLINDGRRFDQVNFEGTKHILALAESLEVPEFLFTSSIKSIGNALDGGPSDESVPYNVGGIDGHYGQSKCKAEKYLLEYSGPVNVKLVNPAMVVGAPDEKPTPMGRIICDFINGRIPFYLDAVFNVVNLDDVAAAHYLVFEKGKSKTKYIVCSATMDMRELFQRLSALTGGRVPRIKMLYCMLLPIAYCNLAASKLSMAPLLLHPNSVRMASLRIKYDGSKIVNELGMAYTPIGEGLKAAVSYFTSICRRLDQ